MSVPLATFAGLMVLSGIAVAIGWVMTFRLTPERSRRRVLRWLGEWSVKGLAAPLAIWGLMNFGVSWRLQPFMPEVQMAQNTGADFVEEFLRVVAIGAVVISSYWAAWTLGWTLWGTSKVVDDEARKDFKALCWTCTLGLIIPALLVLIIGGWAAVGMAALIILVPLAGYTPGLLTPHALPPMYARAVARIKFGKYSEAEWEIIHELEKCEDDVEGWMMLADLYANHFNDLVEAERTIMELCDQPKLTPPQLSVALHKLAGWHLRLGQDPDAARRTLQVICDRLKGTHLARMASARMNQLPRTAEDLREQTEARPIPLPALGESLDQQPAGLDPAKAADLAKKCVERLQQDPNNVVAREKLARVYAEGLNRLDLGQEQLLLLLNLPEQSESKRADWLSLLAAWHIRYREDRDTARSYLERLLREYPELPQAFAARRRLELLDREEASEMEPKSEIRNPESETNTNVE